MASQDVIADGVIKGDVTAVEDGVRNALEEGAAPGDILLKGLIAGMTVVGERFGAGDMFVPELMLAARAMHQGLAILEPLLAESDLKSNGKVVIGTVQGDIHDIGKRIVGFLLEGYGFEVIDIGVDVTPEAFAKAVEEHRPHVLGMSALLTTTMPFMQSTLNCLKEKGLRDQVKVVVGGASVTEDFATSIGSDGYARDASSAVKWVQNQVSSL